MQRRQRSGPSLEADGPAYAVDVDGHAIRPDPSAQAVAALVQGDLGRLGQLLGQIVGRRQPRQPTADDGYASAVALRRVRPSSAAADRDGSGLGLHQSPAEAEAAQVSSQVRAIPCAGSSCAVAGGCEPEQGRRSIFCVPASSRCAASLVLRQSRACRAWEGLVASALSLTFNWYEGRTGWAPAGWDVLWSLSIEEAFYVGFPLLCVWLPRRLLVALLLAWAVCMGPLRDLVPAADEVWREKAYLPGMAALAWGVLAALASVRWRCGPRAARVLAWGGALGILLALGVGPLAASAVSRRQPVPAVPGRMLRADRLCGQRTCAPDRPALAWRGWVRSAMSCICRTCSSCWQSWRVTARCWARNRRGRSWCTRRCLRCVTGWRYC